MIPTSILARLGIRRPAPHQVRPDQPTGIRHWFALARGFSAGVDSLEYQRSTREYFSSIEAEELRQIALGQPLVRDTTARTRWLETENTVEAQRNRLLEERHSWNQQLVRIGGVWTLEPPFRGTRQRAVV